MILDLKAHADKAGKYSNEDAEKALKAPSKMMDVGTHEVILKEFNKLKNAATGVEAELVFAKDPNWVMFRPVFENAAGATASVVIMVPISDRTEYVGESGKATGFIFAKFLTFINAMGFEQEEGGERPELPFINKLIETGGDILNSMVGMQFKLKLYWKEGSHHAKYVSGEKVYYLADWNDNIVLQEPFTPDQNKKGNERWEELINICKLNRLEWNNQPEAEILAHDTVKNNLAMFVRKASKPVAKPILKPSALKTPSPEVVEALEG